MRHLVVVLALALALVAISLTPIVAAGHYNQAPQLEEMVKQGKLPDVDDRLPKEPLVLPTRDSIGVYGGTWQTVDERIDPRRFYGVGFQSSRTLLTVSGGLRGAYGTIVPNLAKDFKANANKTKFTIMLREGLKWSDGQPYTTTDIEFWYKDVLLNKDLTPGIPSTFKAGDETMKLRVIDNYTFELEFAEPKPLFLGDLALYFRTSGMTTMPKHYMKQFHPNYASKGELDRMVQAEDADTWMNLFGKKNDDRMRSNTEKPRLGAWTIVRGSPNPYPWYWERNPYFWAVDQEGNQLPYIDVISHEQLQPEVVSLRALSGSSVFPIAHAIIAQAKEAEEKGIVQVILTGHILEGMQAIYLNQTYEKDKVLRDIFRDRRFRYAVSHAMNRGRIDELQFLGLGLAKPAQLTPLPAGELYDEKLAPSAGAIR